MSPEECEPGMTDDDGNRCHFISAGEQLQARSVVRKVGLDEDLFLARRTVFCAYNKETDSRQPARDSALSLPEHRPAVAR